MSTGPPTEVCISIDTEFSIAGHFDNPETHKPVAEPVVYGEVNGKEEGLGFLLETFEKYSVRASFFVECANYFYFGDEPMRSVVRRLQAANQDIQLHVHPVWLSFNEDQSLGEFPRHDDCSGRSFEELQRVFATCIDVFERWVGHKPHAIRTGSLRADDNVYRVMQSLGIAMSSNIAMGIFPPPEPALHFDSGRHLIHGVMELPVFSYQDSNLGGRAHKKSLQITSCSWPEMRNLLWRARAAGVQNVVVLTHPFEFFKKSDVRYSKLQRNRVNQRRLQHLCHFLSSHEDDFMAADFGSAGERWTASEFSQPYIHMPSAYALGRKLHNKLNDVLWRY